MTAKYLYVLGAYTDEMVVMKKLLTAIAAPFTYATKNGRFVTTNNAYKADGLQRQPEKLENVVFIDCHVEGVKAVQKLVPPSRTAHFDPWSPTYFYGCSVVGQLTSLLISNARLAERKAVSEKLEPYVWEAKMAAASTYYLSAAYQGRCPGVDPTALRLWRAMNRAESKDCKPKEILSATDSAIFLLKDLPVFEEIKGADIRKVDCYVPEMYEAAAIAGLTVMYSRYDKKAEKTKVSLINASPSTIEVWVEWALGTDSGVTDVYGSAVKGYAGAFKREVVEA